MCFSAQASFIASGCLTVAGIACLKRNRLQRAAMFAAIPLLFAVQQFAEGMLWLSFDYDWPQANLYAPYIFLFFAFVIWPIWIPLSLRMLEKHHQRTLCLSILSLLGIATAIYLYQFIMTFGASARAMDCHIYYQLQIADRQTLIGTVIYLMTTILPFFISSLPIMWLFGAILALSYAISYICYYQHILSVWCFCAAVLSALVYVAIDRINKA